MKSSHKTQWYSFTISTCQLLVNSVAVDCARCWFSVKLDTYPQLANASRTSGLKQEKKKLSSRASPSSPPAPKVQPTPCVLSKVGSRRSFTETKLSSQGRKHQLVRQRARRPGASRDDGRRVLRRHRPRGPFAAATGREIHQHGQEDWHEELPRGEQTRTQNFQIPELPRVLEARGSPVI